MDAKRVPLNEALVHVIDRVGGQAKLARLLKARTGDSITQSNVWSWLFGSGRVPSEYLFVIEAIAKEAGCDVTAKDLAEFRKFEPSVSTDADPHAQAAG